MASVFRRPAPRSGSTWLKNRTMLHVSRFLRSVARVSQTHYPRFIFGLPPRRDDIPVFTYHDVETTAFSHDLEFLQSNGYRTLDLEEYLGARAGKYRIERRSVLLTFDDARKSFWEVALPLLRTYSARVVLFAPSFWMTPPSASGSRDDLFMGWEQLRACLASGLVDVQSHAHRHALVPISPRVVDFAHPQALRRFDIYDWPMRFANGGDELGRPPLGTPVYRAEPLLSAPRRYLENGELTHACQRLVEQSGSSEFFLRPSWQAKLASFHRKNLAAMPGRSMNAAEFRKLVASEFELSRAEFETHLGYAPHTIAYPWRLGSTLSLQLAQRNGFRTAFGVALDFRAERNRSKLPIPVFGRLKCDWLRFLPGRHRSNVFATFGRKVRGFASVQHLAH